MGGIRVSGEYLDRLLTDSSGTDECPIRRPSRSRRRRTGGVRPPRCFRCSSMPRAGRCSASPGRICEQARAISSGEPFVLWVVVS